MLALVLELPPPMKSFFHANGLQESDLTLEFIQLIKDILFDWENGRLAFLTAYPPRILNHAQVGIGPYEMDTDDES